MIRGDRANTGQLKRGSVIYDEKGERYLVLSQKGNSLNCMTGDFNFCGMGVDFLKYYYFLENLDMDVMEKAIVGGEC